MQGREAAGIEDRSLTALGGMTGQDFDRAFVERQLQLYPRMAELYQTMASNSPEPALARFGITALAALRRHFETAKALGTRFGLSTGTSGNSAAVLSQFEGAEPMDGLELHRISNVDECRSWHRA